MNATIAAETNHQSPLLGPDNAVTQVATTRGKKRWLDDGEEQGQHKKSEEFSLYSWKELSGDPSTLELNLKPRNSLTSCHFVLEEIDWVDIIETNRLRLSCDMNISEVRDLDENW